MTCPVCHCVPREAVAHICGKLFCHSCWSRWRTARERCPMCNDEESDAAPAYSDRKNILNMQFRCHTCNQAVRLGDKKKHVEADCNRPTACPLCNSKVTPATLQDHMVGSCPRRLVPCPDCQAEMTASELEAHQDSLSCENQALHNKVRMLEKEITSTKDKLQKLKGEKKSTSKKVEHTELGDENMKLKAALAEREDRIAKLEAELAEKDGTIAKLEADMAKVGGMPKVAPTVLASSSKAPAKDKSFLDSVPDRVRALTTAKEDAVKRKDNQEAKRLEEQVKQVQLAVSNLKFLEALMEEAAAKEDYDRAEKLAVLAEEVQERGLRLVQDPLLELLARRREAVAAKDFRAAKQLTVEIDSLREADACAGAGACKLGGKLIGVLVRRGPEWQSQDGDGGAGGLGVTVETHPQLELVRVRWHNGGSKERWYCVGQGNPLELMRVL